MGKERSERYNTKKYNDYKAKVNKAIKTGRFMGRTSMGDFSPLLHNLIKEGYLDLIKKCLDNQKDPEKKRQMIVDKYDYYGDKVRDGGKNSIEFTSDITIKELLEKTLYNLWLEKKNKKDE